MKFFSLILCFLTAALLAAAGFDTDFTAYSQRAEWRLNTWSGYKPLPKVKYDAAEKALHIFDGKGPRGFGVANYSRRLESIAGDTVKITAAVKGKGRFSVSTQTFSEGKWSGIGKAVSFDLTPQWSTVSAELPVQDLGKKKTDEIIVAFTCSKGSEIKLQKFSVQVIRNVPRIPEFPVSWRVFAPVDPKYAPSAAELAAVPAALGKVKGKDLKNTCGLFDLAEITGRTGVRNCGWFFAEINAPTDNYAYRIGAGADWWMRCFVNGKAVIDTMKNGNIKSPPAMDDHIAPVILKKGKNIIAFQLITGRSSLLTAGGPVELKRQVKELAVSKRLFLDNYDDASVKRQASPRIIQGYPTQGLLILTGQGVYQTKDLLKFRPKAANALLTGKQFFTTSLRIQNFGNEKADPASLSFEYARSGKRFAMKLSFVPGAKDLQCDFIDNGTVVRKCRIPVKLLPADFNFSFARTGTFFFETRSLADSSTVTASGYSPFFKSAADGTFRTEIVLRAQKKNSRAEVTVDNLMTAISLPGKKVEPMGLKIERSKFFDPVKAGWPLVFSDEFNGKSTDLTKWSIKGRPDHISYDKGVLKIKTDFGKDGKLESAGLASTKWFQYGYFEARLKFTKQPGSWSAFWLNGRHHTNPFLEGLEIDIFEDYFTRSKTYAKEKYPVLDHNLHVYVGETIKSWNYISRLPGRVDQFYVIGCKWTPFEISHYLNGKQLSGTANHSPHDSVTFDAWHHIATTAPLQTLLSGCLMRKGYSSSNWYPASAGKYPQFFEIDYVRIYAYPEKGKPVVKLTGDITPKFQKAGSILEFKVKVSPDPVTKSPIKGVYLFDNGTVIAHKERPPYDFKISFSKEFFNTTRYVEGGRAGRRKEFNGYPHIFKVFAQAADGSVAYSDSMIRIPYWDGAKPYMGKRQNIPGVISFSKYDEGGQGKGYFDTSKGNRSSKTYRTGEDVDCGPGAIGFNPRFEWLSYQVDIAKARKYDLVLTYGSPLKEDQSVMVFLNEKLIAEIPVSPSKTWNCDAAAVCKGIMLPAGKHTLRIMTNGRGINLAKLEFK